MVVTNVDQFPAEPVGVEIVMLYVRVPEGLVGSAVMLSGRVKYDVEVDVEFVRLLMTIYLIACSTVVVPVQLGTELHPCTSTDVVQNVQLAQHGPGSVVETGGFAAVIPL